MCSGKAIHNYFSFFNNLIWYFPRLLNLMLGFVTNRIHMVMKLRLLINLIIFIQSVSHMWDFYEIFNQTGFTIPLFAKNQLISIGVSFHLVALEPQKKYLSRPNSVIPSLAQSLLQQILSLLLQLSKCNYSIPRNKSTIKILNKKGCIIYQCDRFLLSELIELNEGLILVPHFKRRR